ncbi:putative hydroxymethylpyrimidine transporter CytX [Seinonella peptonophila]|uniref:Putative hydroxymethylpyrimidine transporter CytX n=1 Tax=Seinonella peptonophila TaxID=112248 RepID=A0A1M4YDY2_9BACL|nr:cytosine permease [Seinonella peptonophila]SHF03945.1 putative hydroxymethylpyrimidine transporter CytX [Seinonella peptonophila]
MEVSNQFGQDSVKPTLQSERTMRFFSTLSLWIAANVVVTTIFTGMLLVPDLTITQAISMIILGSIIGAVPLLFTGNVGTRTGLPTMILMRGAFGYRGAALPSAVNVIVLIGWSWIQAYMGGLSLNHAVRFLTGYDNINLFVIFVEVLVVIIALYGHRGIERTENIIASSMLVLSLIVFTYMFLVFDLGELIEMPTSTNPKISMVIGFDMVVATAFSWMPTAADFNRHCADEKTGMIGTLLGYFIGTVVAMALGATVSGFSIMQGGQQNYDPTTLIGGLNPILGFIAGIVIFLSVLSTNTMALYSASMSFLAIFHNRKFFLPTLIMGIIAVLGALWKEQLLLHFQAFLTVIGTLFIPVISIFLVDYYLLKRKNYDADEIIYGNNKRYWYSNGINYFAYVAYILGAVFAYYFTYVHPLSIGSTVLTFFFTAILYWLLMKTRKVAT